MEQLEQVRNVRLYGKMGAKFGRHFRLAVKTPAEAVQALAAQLPGFEEYLYGAKDKGFGFAVFVGKNNLKEDELSLPSGNSDIRIAPMVFGGKQAGVFQIIVGVVLIIIGAILTYFGYGAYGIPIMKMGLAMVIGGIVQLLIPVPKTQSAKEGGKEDPNYSFNGPINTTAQGHPVPVLYGRMKIGSAVVSAGITLKDEHIIPYPGLVLGGGNLWDNIYDEVHRNHP